MPARSLLAAGLSAALGAAAGACGGGDAVPQQAAPSAQFAGVTAVRTSATLAHDPDDPAIWVHPTAPERSLVLGTVKVAAPDGGVAVFGLDGALRQLVTGIDRPNNIDVEYGFTFGGRTVDIAVITERYQRRLRVFSIAPDGSGISDLGVVPVLEGQLGEAQAPMGIGLYRRGRDGAVFAIISPKTGPAEGYLWQYRLQEDSGGKLTATFVRRFGRFSGTGEIEAVAVDDEAGHVYYADEGDGLHKWHADPDHAEAATELAYFARDGFAGDREGTRSILARATPDTSWRPISCQGTAGITSTRVRRQPGPQSITRRFGCSPAAPIRRMASRRPRGISAPTFRPGFSWR